ncbi:hypothetical protein ACTJIJ_23020 [Niabella sp. 22666]|uniref:hypothetical protein n=1 Tax=Niabella sp. 22666 TaxID=3453954 RepID=UPI003F82D5A5
MARDLLYGEDGDLIIENNDLVIGLSDYQHVELLLKCEAGEFKESPLVGVGINKYINGKMDGQLYRLINLQLEADGFKTLSVEMKGEQISIDGNY